MGKTNDVRDAVEDELTFDPDASDITVENTDGTVSLNGTVPSYPQYVAAAAGAQRVVGVKYVLNHLKVALQPGDYRDDPTLTATANNALTLNNAVSAGVEATAANGNVTLTGTVRDTTERAAAELMVAELTGVRSVKNDIQMRDDTGPADVIPQVQGSPVLTPVRQQHYPSDLGNSSQARQPAAAPQRLATGWLPGLVQCAGGPA